MALGDKERAKELLEKSSSETVKYFEKDTRQIHLAKDKKDGESVAFLELPKYIPEEIEKALDIDVDELVNNRKNLPDVVLRSLYDEKVEQLRVASERITELEGIVADLEAQLSQVTSERDNEIERRISAELALAELENLYIALSDQFAQTVFELQKAIERSTQEAIERVSLEARFEAIKAQLNATLLAVEVAEAQIEAREEQILVEQSANLVEEILSENGNLGPLSYYQFGNSGVALYIKTANDESKLAPSTNWTRDNGFIRWKNKNNQPKNHLNGRINSGNAAEVFIKSVIAEEVTIRYDGFVVLDHGNESNSGNNYAKNYDTKTAGPFHLYKNDLGTAPISSGGTFTVPAAPSEQGVVTQAVNGDKLLFGSADDLSGKTSWSHDAGAVGNYKFTWVETGQSITVPWAAKQLQADKE